MGRLGRNAFIALAALFLSALVTVLIPVLNHAMNEGKGRDGKPRIVDLSTFTLWNPQGQVAHQGPLRQDSTGPLYAYPLGLEVTSTGGNLLYGFSAYTYGFPTGALRTGFFLTIPAAAALQPTPVAASQANNGIPKYFTLVGDRYVATLPQFFGANPAVVPRDVGRGAPKAGFRLLGSEEDLARQWLASLSAGQRGRAIFDSRTYGDIVSRNAPRAQALDAVGLPFGEMDAAQQALALKLIGAFADHLRPELAQARLARVRAAPLDTLRIGWAGSTQPGRPHYFRIQGANFLIEYDNSGGNHVHSVWRDLDGDFGRDVLREHYRRAEGSPHRHGAR